MAEKHQKTTISTVGDFMYAIFSMVQTSGQTAVRWADNDSTHAIYSGTAFINATAVTSTTFNATGSYMVIECATAMPSGLRWQVKISRTTGNANLYTNFAPRGGWTYGTQVFDATKPSTGNIDAFNGVVWTGPARVLVSTSDLDVYNGSSVASYLRAYIWESTQLRVGFQVGGYIPFDTTNNTNPCVLLTNKPFFNNNGTTVTWGYPTANASNLNRMSPDYTGAQLNLATAGYCHIQQIYGGWTNRDPNANWVNIPVYIRCIDDAAIFGYFGKYCCVGGDTTRALATADSAGEYLCVNDIMFRWKPTA